MPTCKFTKKLFHTSFFIYFVFVSPECITFTSSKEALKVLNVCEHNSFQRKVALLVIYLFNHDSSKSTIFTLNMASDILLSRFLSHKLESVLSCNIKLFVLSFDMHFFL